MRKKLSTIINDVRFIARYLSELESRQLMASDCALALRDDAALDSLISQESVVSQYCRAVRLNRVGNLEEAEDLLQRIIAVAPLPIQARALVTLGSLQIEGGNYGDAHSSFSQARRAATDSLSALGALKMTAVLHSIIGRHRLALDELERGLPLACSISPQHPIRLDFYNSVACELNAIGSFRQAFELASVVTASAVAPRYPEWLATAREAALPLPSRSLLGLSYEFKMDSGARIIKFPERPIRSQDESRAVQQLKATWVASNTKEPTTVEAFLAIGEADRQSVETCIRLLKNTGVRRVLVDRVLAERDEEFLRSMLQMWDRSKACRAVKAVKNDELACSTGLNEVRKRE